VEAVGLILGWWCAASVVAATSWSVVRTVDKRRQATAERQQLLTELRDVEAASTTSSGGSGSWRTGHRD
jgi:hypothetical protein